MKNNMLIPAFLLAIVTFAGNTMASDQHKLVTSLLDAENASYVVTGDESVSIITYGYKEAASTCIFLQNKGISVESVENYTSDAGGMLIITSKTC